MKIINVARYEEVTVILEEGIDYEAADLVITPWSNGQLKEINSGKLTEIARENGYDKWSWAGHANIERTGNSKAHFLKHI